MHFIIVLTTWLATSEQTDKIVIPYEKCPDDLCFGYDINGMKTNPPCWDNTKLTAPSCTALAVVKGHSSSEMAEKYELYLNTSAKDNIWIGFGLSVDRKMGDDVVALCSPKETNTDQVQFSWNYKRDGQLMNTVANVTTKNGLQAPTLKYVDGLLHCSYTLKHEFQISVELNEKPEEKSFDVKNKYHILLADGLTTDGVLRKHLRTQASVEAHTLKHFKATTTTTSTTTEKPKTRKCEDDFNRVCSIEGCQSQFPLENEHCVALEFPSDNPCRTEPPSTCDFKMTIRFEDDKFHFGLQIVMSDSTKKGRHGVYFAVGLSDDQKMGRDSVTEWLWTRATNNFSLQTSYNTAHGKNTQDVKRPATHVQIIAITNDDKTWKLTWSQAVNFTHSGKKFDASERPLFVLLAYGRLLKHGDRHTKRAHRDTHVLEFPLVHSGLNVKVPGDCKESRNCFGIRQDAVGDSLCLKDKVKGSCIAVLASERRDNEHSFTVSTVVGGDYWVAFGLSEDEKMGDDAVFECGSSTGALVSHNKKVNNIDAENVTGVDSEYKKDAQSCSFTVKKQFSYIAEGSRKEYDLDKKKYHVLMAFGRRDRANEVKVKHAIKAYVGPLEQESELTESTSKTIIYVVVVVVVVAFVLLATATMIAVVLAFRRKRSRKMALQAEQGVIKEKKSEIKEDTENLRVQSISIDNEINTIASTIHETKAHSRVQNRPLKNMKLKSAVGGPGSFTGSKILFKRK